jgi:hypothetical protein
VTARLVNLPLLSVPTKVAEAGIEPPFTFVTEAATLPGPLAVTSPVSPVM